MLVVRKSRIKGAGRGLFTTSRIRKGDVIVEYLGEKLTWKQCLKRYKKDLTKLLYVFCINDDNCVDAKYTPDELAQYANDANGTPKEKRKYENNCEYNIIKGKPYIVATKNIPANSEILVDYGDDYWEAVTENQEAKEKKTKSRKENKSRHGVDPKSRTKTKRTKSQHAADSKKLLQPLIDPDALPKSRNKTKKKKDRTHRSEYKRKKSSRAVI
jgi:hypothetical protein